MIGIFQGSPEGRANECQKAKGGQKEGFPGQRPKSRAKEGHGRAPSQKQGSLAAMALTHAYPKISKTVTHSGCLDWGLELQTL